MNQKTQHGVCFTHPYPILPILQQIDIHRSCKATCKRTVKSASSSFLWELQGFCLSGWPFSFLDLSLFIAITTFSMFFIVASLAFFRQYHLNEPQVSQPSCYDSYLAIIQLQILSMFEFEIRSNVLISQLTLFL